MGFRVLNYGFWSLRYRVHGSWRTTLERGLRLGVWGWGSGIRVMNLRIVVYFSGLGFRASGFRVQGSGFRV
jgi:hypothetical protein